MNKFFISVILFSLPSLHPRCAVIAHIVNSYANGNAREIAYFENGRQIAKRHFDEKGQLQKYKGNIPDGYVYTLYSNGKVHIRDTFANNKINGTRTEYYENGVISSKIQFKDSLCHGQVQTYYNDSNIYETFTCQNGKLHGVYRVYSKEAVIIAKEPYLNGYISGLSQEYYENGSIKQEVSYINSKKNGIVNIYNRKGKILKSAFFKDDKLHGQATAFYNNGKKHYADIYQNGIKIKRLIYKSEKVKKEIPYMNCFSIKKG